MANFPDDIYLGYFEGSQGMSLQSTSERNPTAQNGVGPMARVMHRNFVPLTLSTVCLAALQAPTSGTGLTLVAGTSAVTLGVAPDGSGATVYVLDRPRAISLTSTSDLSAINFLITGFDDYGVRMTQLKTGPNNNTVNTLKAFASVLSIVPTGTSASTVSVGNSDIFGFPFVISDAVFLLVAKWNATLADNAGTFVAADATTPATNLTGDVRGTFAQAGAASNGVRRLMMMFAMTATQVGSSPTRLAALGVAQA